MIRELEVTKNNKKYNKAISAFAMGSVLIGAILTLSIISLDFSNSQLAGLVMMSVSITTLVLREVEL